MDVDLQALIAEVQQSDWHPVWNQPIMVKSYILSFSVLREDTGEWYSCQYWAKAVIPEEEDTPERRHQSDDSAMTNLRHKLEETVSKEYVMVPEGERLGKDADGMPKFELIKKKIKAIRLGVSYPGRRSQ